MQDIIKTLQQNEVKVLPILKAESDFRKVLSLSGLKDVEVMRAWQWLQAKGLLEIQEQANELLVLGANGAAYKQKGLPERRLLTALKDGQKTAAEIKKSLSFDEQEFSIALGVLKKKAAVNIEKAKELTLSLAENGKKLCSQEFLEEKFLAKDFPIDASALSPEEKFAFDALSGRKDIVRKEKVKIFSAKLTPQGVKAADALKKGRKEYAERLTKEMLADGSWKGKEFRAYNVEIPVPSISGGKRHFVRQSIEYAKQVWMDMGFKEMEGPLVNTSFWNFDALFTAQDHPVREMQDTFFIKEPAKGELPEKIIVDSVKAAHEKGIKGSLGWRYNWNPEEAKKNVLRTHTTVLSAKTIASLKKSDLPVKFFALGRCFRNEAVDWCHLFEFNQTEGIVIDRNANFRHLIGYLKQFLRKMGYEKARFRPAHFPYTEPSIEIDVYHPVHKKWVELGGAGIFRPEVVEPLFGEAIPVLAWGPGFDRIMMEYYKIADLRDLYKNDIKQLKAMKAWLR